MTSAALLPFAGGCGVLDSRRAGAAVSGPRNETRISLSSLRTAVLAALNLRRVERDLVAVQPSAALDLASLAHARDLAGQGQLSHYGTDTRSPRERAAQVGFHNELLGEVLARSRGDEIAVLNGWLDTAETREVLLDPQARQMGIAVRIDGAGMGWWVLMIGTTEDQG